MKQFRLCSAWLCLALILCLLAGCAAPTAETQAPSETTLPPETTAPPATQPAEEPLPAGYTDVVYHDGAFWAVGSGGRIDRIDENHNIDIFDTRTEADLTRIWSDGKNLLACGANGTLLYSGNGKNFNPVPIDTDQNLCGAALLDDELYAATVDGHVYRSADWGKTWSDELPEAPDSLLALTSTDTQVIAISRDTDVYLTEGGPDWYHENFNEKYDGLYPPYVFSGLVGAGSTFFVLGYERDTPTFPLIMFTEDTEVWMQKGLVQINGEYPDPDAMLRVRDLTFNMDQIVGVANDRQLLTIPDCMNCNQSRVLDGTGELTAVAASENYVIAVGEDFFYQLIDNISLRQDHIQAAQALTDQQEYGAIIVDVREQQELIDEGYIPGALHIPVGQVEELLPELVPDPGTELIFYCKAGVRAQTALEKAMELGYSRVYNLGGLSDWPYEIARDATEDTP